jgi:hypothetical protein
MSDDKLNVSQGTLTSMALKTLLPLGPLHGSGIARRIKTSQRRFAFHDLGRRSNGSRLLPFVARLFLLSEESQ